MSRRPPVDNQKAAELLKTLYDIEATRVKELVAYDDRNFWIKSSSGDFVLKVTNTEESQNLAYMAAQTSVMLHLSQEGFSCSTPRKTLDGNYYTLLQLGENKHVVRLLTFVPGQELNDCPPSNTFYLGAGEFLGRISTSLAKIEVEYYRTHRHVWMLEEAGRAREYTYVVKDPQRRQLVEGILDRFQREVVERKESFESCLTYGDYNEHNVIAEQFGDEWRVTGLIDFGDLCYSLLLFELAVGMTYILMHSRTLESGGFFLRGFESTRNLRPEEKKYLKLSIQARLCQSLVMGLYYNSLEPSNTYVLSSQVPGWHALEMLSGASDEEVERIWEVKA